MLPRLALLHSDARLGDNALAGFSCEDYILSSDALPTVVQFSLKGTMVVAHIPEAKVYPPFPLQSLLYASS